MHVSRLRSNIAVSQQTHIANVDVSRTACSHNGGNARGAGPARLAPSDLEPPIADHETLRVHHLVQREGGFGHDKVDEADVLLWDELDALDDSASDRVADVFARRVGMQVAHCVADEGHSRHQLRRSSHQQQFRARLTVDASIPSLDIRVDEAAREWHG